MLAPDLLLDFPHLGRKEFHGRAALCADHVVMAAALVLVLVAGDAVVKSDFAGEAALGEKLERAINGGESDARVLFLDQPVQFVGGEMLAGFKECAQDGIALSGLLQADAAKMLQEDGFGFAKVFPRNGALIVDALG